MSERERLSAEPVPGEEFIAQCARTEAGRRFQRKFFLEVFEAFFGGAPELVRQRVEAVDTVALTYLAFRLDILCFAGAGVDEVLAELDKL